MKINLKYAVAPFLFILCINVFFAVFPFDYQYFEPEHYVKTYKDSINGKVTRVFWGKGYTGVALDDNDTNTYKINYFASKVPKELKRVYEERRGEGFVLSGDSIVKSPNSDVFYITRKGRRLVYYLTVK